MDSRLLAHAAQSIAHAAQPRPRSGHLARVIQIACATLLGSCLSHVSLADDRAPWVGESLNGTACQGGNPGNFGPFDYTVDKDKLPVVERRHFTPQVEQLERGESNVNAISDISYTLVRFPNHHRALYSAVRFSLGEGGGDRQRYNAECFLQRAIHFSPRDPVPRMLFGLYLHRLGQLDASLEHYRVAESLSNQNANLYYNIGLVLFDLGDFEASNRYAQEAYRYDIGLPGLQRKLKEAGHWQPDSLQ